MRTTAPIVRPMQAFTVTRPEQTVMKNGIPLKIIREGAQEVVRLDIIIGAGRWNQTQSLQALFTTRMLREGTKALLSAQIAERLDYYGSWLDLSTTMQHSILTLYTLSKHFPDTLAIVEQLLKEPIFPEEQLELVLRNNRQQFLINREKVNFLSQQALCAAAFGPNHPMGISVEEWDYDRISAAQLREFFEKYYHSGNCKVFLSGLITKKEIQLVEETLGNETWGDIKSFVSPPNFLLQKTDKKRIFLPKADSMQCAVSLGALMPTCQDPDSLGLRVLIMVLGGYFGSRLMANIREEKGFTYGIQAHLTHVPDTGLLVISSETTPENVEPLIHEVYCELKRLKEEIVPEEELERVRAYMMGEMARTYEGAFSLAEAWLHIELSHLPYDHPEQAMRILENISGKELQALAQKYFDEKSIFEIVAGGERIKN